MLHRSKETFEILECKEHVIERDFTTPHQVRSDKGNAGCGLVISENEHGFMTVCGYTGLNGYVYCDNCTVIVEDTFPQGYDYYPGDTCKHGTYVGGCGIDWMCFECEME